MKKRFKKTLRRLGFVCLLLLAVFGVGLAGGIPIPPSNKRENDIEIIIELLESKVDQVELIQLDVQN